MTIVLEVNQFKSVAQVIAFIEETLNDGECEECSIDGLYDLLWAYKKDLTLNVIGLENLPTKLIDEFDELIDMFEYLQEEKENFTCMIDECEI